MREQAFLWAGVKGLEATCYITQITGLGNSWAHVEPHLVPGVRKMIFPIKIFVTLLDYLKIPQVAILGDLHV
jgi:hypothetical protein